MHLVRIFYDRVSTDDLLGPVFARAVPDWTKHRQVLTAFWCQIELGIRGFRGSPVKQHAALASVEPLTSDQFGRWVWLFCDTVDSAWRGPHAESIKLKATALAHAQARAVPNACWNGELNAQVRSVLEAPHHLRP
ncbi:MAG: sec-independent protein translocase TatC [Maricaulis sp.]|nr:sec-independent protein translocase TatC [Maricaulis sp.]